MPVRSRTPQDTVPEPTVVAGAGCESKFLCSAGLLGSLAGQGVNVRFVSGEVVGMDMPGGVGSRFHEGLGFVAGHGFDVGADVTKWPLTRQIRYIEDCRTMSDSDLE